MSAAAESSRERELEQLPKSELVRRLLAAEQAQQQPAATHESASTSISGDTTGAVASRGVKRSTPDGGGGGRGTRGKKGKAAKKKKKAFDMSRCRQRHVALKVAYYGQRYHGFAAQDDNDNTIEAHLFHALQRTCLIKDRDSANYSRCGRTDKGVSALGQVVGLYLRSKHTDDANPALLSREAVAAAAAPKAPRPPPKPAAGGSGADSGGESEDEGDAPGYTLAQAARNEVVRDPSDWATPEPESELNYIKMLNGVLPPEIRVLGWAHVPPSSLFSARFSCKQRVYHYYFPKGALDTAAMAEAASSFVGEHDFRNFCKMDVANVTHFMRRITAFTVETVDSTGGPGGPFGMCYLRIEGTAFLWHQVRCMAAVLFMVGNRLEEPSIVADLLDIEKHPRKPQYPMASDQPLVLAQCRFDNLQFRIDPDAADKLRQTLYEQWAQHSIAGAMAQFGAGTVLEQQSSGSGSGAAGVALADAQLENALRSGLRNHIPLDNRAKEDSYDVRRGRHDEREATKAAAAAAAAASGDGDGSGS